MTENRFNENLRRDGAFSESNLEAANSEASTIVVPPSMTTPTEPNETSLQTTNFQTSQDQDDQPARRKPTGPRTERGKKRSSQNAIKFGIHSEAMLLEGESRPEYQRLLEGLRQSFQPVGMIEDILVEKLTTISWRYRRLLLAEGAEIQRISEFLEFDRRQKEQQEAEQIGQKRQAGTKVVYTSEPVGLIWTIENPDLLERCLEILVELRQGIEAKGFDEEEDGSLLKTIYGDPDQPHLRQTLHQRYLVWFKIAVATQKERQREGFPTSEQCKEAVLSEIDTEIDRLNDYSKKREEVESKRRKVEVLRQRVPDSLGLDRLLRSEASLERAFDRTLTQLERLQRIRKGQPLPPQLDMNIS